MVDELSDLPDLTDTPEVHTVTPEADSPSLELQRLAQRNSERMAALSAKGAVMNDGHPLITSLVQNALLEEILQRVCGPAEATDALLTVQLRVAEFLDACESQVTKAILSAPAAVPPSMQPGGNNRHTRRHG